MACTRRAWIALVGALRALGALPFWACVIKNNDNAERFKWSELSLVKPEDKAYGKRTVSAIGRYEVDIVVYPNGTILTRVWRSDKHLDYSELAAASHDCKTIAKAKDWCIRTAVEVAQQDLSRGTETLDILGYRV